MSGTNKRVVVVTGGAAGIGAGIAMELGRTGAFVVTLDPMVTVDGASSLDAHEVTTAERIVADGGDARHVSVSVTDGDAVDALLKDLVAEFGGVDAVINVAGITRPTSFGMGDEAHWKAIFDVHLHGYINVLKAALPIMAAAGHGQIIGVTSGSGWRAANAGAYSSAKRAVAALTWQIAGVAPPGVTVNALSPIAATRMVTQARPAGEDADSGDSQTGGLNLSAMPAPESLGPVGAYLASEQFEWCNGQVIFSSGAEVAIIEAPRLLEVVRSSDVTSLSHLLGSAALDTFATAEAAQEAGGASNPRFAGAFSELATGASRPPACSHVLVVSDDQASAHVVSSALEFRGISCVVVGSGASGATVGFAAAASELETANPGRTLDGVVLALSGENSNVKGSGTWKDVLSDHASLPGALTSDAAWMSALSAYVRSEGHALRVVSICDAHSWAGRSRAQAAAQLARASLEGSNGQVAAFAIGVESPDYSGRRAAADLATSLLATDDVTALVGAELVVGEGWLGIRSHPAPATTISFGGPKVPEWLDATLRRALSPPSNA